MPIAVIQDLMDELRRARSQDEAEAMFREALGVRKRELTAEMSTLHRQLQQLSLRGDILTAQVSHLSTGERQRLALLRAIVRRPRFLLLDEPTSALDPQTTLAVESMLEAVMADGMGLLMVSHNADQAARLHDAQFRLGRHGMEVVAA